jgi:hypothetical protein
MVFCRFCPSRPLLRQPATRFAPFRIKKSGRYGTHIYPFACALIPQTLTQVSQKGVKNHDFRKISLILLGPFSKKGGL